MARSERDIAGFLLVTLFIAALGVSIPGVAAAHVLVQVISAGGGGSTMTVTQGVYAVFGVSVAEVDDAGMATNFDWSKISISISGLPNGYDCAPTPQVNTVNCLVRRPYHTATLQIGTSGVSPGSYVLVVTATDTSIGSSATATGTLNVSPSATYSNIVVHSSRTINWIARSDIYQSYKNSFQNFFDFSQPAYDQIEQFLGLGSPIVPVEIHVTDDWRYGAWSSFGKLGFSYAMLVSDADVAPSWIPGLYRPVNEWTYSLIVHEMTNVFTGSVTSDWPTDWWADDRSPFPAMVNVKVLEAMGQENFAILQDASLRPDPLYQMFKTLQETYGWGMFQRAFSMMQLDGIELSQIDVGLNPSPLKSLYVAYYLSEGAGADLSGQLNAAFASANPPITYTIDSTEISGIRNARNMIYEAQNAILNAQNRGLDITSAQGYLNEAWRLYRIGQYEDAEHQAELAINAANSATTTTTTMATTTTVTTPNVMVTFQLSGVGFDANGAIIWVDGGGVPQPSQFPVSYLWAPGSTHTITASSPVDCGFGCQYVWTSWSDGGGQSHAITVPSSPSTYVVSFKKQYSLTVQVNESGGGTTNPTPGSYWYDPGSSVTITATANPGYSFTSWSGSGTGSYSGMNNPSSVTINGPITEFANFLQTTTTSTAVATTTTMVTATTSASTTQDSRVFYGTVFSGSTGQPLAGATVTASGPGYGQLVVTASDGGWNMQLPYGTYTITISATGFQSQSFQLNWDATSVFSGGSVTLLPLATTTTLVTTTTVTAYATVTSGASTQGLVMQVVSNSSVSDLVFNSVRGLLNFTVSGPPGTIGFINVKIARSLLSGEPVVLVDGVQQQAVVTGDPDFWYVYSSYYQSSHHITIGGSGTVPEFDHVFQALLVIVMSLTLILVRRRRRD
jgi:hypothetical protein